MQRIVWIIALLAALTAPVIMAAKIYKWSDPEGHIHYGEFPPAGQPAETIEGRTPRGHPPPAGPATLPEVSSRSNPEEAAGEPGAGEQRAPPTAQEPERVREHCQKARQNLQNLQIGGSNRRFRNPSGKIVRYTHAQRQAKITATRRYLEQHCTAD